MGGDLVSAVEEIQAAIEKLTVLKAESTPGVWRPIMTSGEHWDIRAKYSEELVASITTNDGSSEARRDADARLIATLHRTIDAQLEILTDAVVWFNDSCCDGHGLKGSAPALTLARAINGMLKE